MFVSICARTFSLSEPLLLRADPAQSELRSSVRRMTKTPTLDGGAAIYDGGFADADRAMTLLLPPAISRKTISAIERLRDHHLRVTVATDEGVFEALIERFSFSGSSNTLTLSIAERLSE